MPHHFQKSITETTEWCNKCERLTTHIVSDGRLGRCKEHSVGDADGLSVAQRKRKEQQEKDRREPKLF